MISVNFWNIMCGESGTEMNVEVCSVFLKKLEVDDISDLKKCNTNI
jgi:hypothetical protein